MDPTLQLVVNIGAAATALAAIIGLPVAFVKLWPLLKRAVTIGASLEKLPEMALEISALTIGQRTQGETLAHQSEQLAVIKHEVEFNNGSSVKDAVVRTEKATKALTETTAALGDTLAAHLAAPQVNVNVNPGSAQ